MANEATLMVEYEPAVSMPCTDANAMEMGTILILSDPNTVSAHTGAVALVAGILGAEKIANDGQQAKVYKRGRFKFKGSGTITVGDPLVTDTHLNHLKSARALTAFDLSGTRIIGYALETMATGDTGLMELSITPMNGV